MQRAPPDMMDNKAHSMDPRDRRENRVSLAQLDSLDPWDGLELRASLGFPDFLEVGVPQEPKEPQDHRVPGENLEQLEHRVTRDWISHTIMIFLERGGRVHRASRVLLDLGVKMVNQVGQEVQAKGENLGNGEVLDLRGLRVLQVQQDVQVDGDFQAGQEGLGQPGPQGRQVVSRELRGIKGPLGVQVLQGEDQEHLVNREQLALQVQEGSLDHWVLEEGLGPLVRLDHVESQERGVSAERMVQMVGVAVQLDPAVPLDHVDLHRERLDNPELQDVQVHLDQQADLDQLDPLAHLGSLECLAGLGARALLAQQAHQHANFLN